MGSGSSTQVKTMEEEPNDTEESSRKLSKATPTSKTLKHSKMTTSPSAKTSVTSFDNSTTTPVTKLDNPVSHQTGYEQKIAELEKELGNSESEKLDLQDRVQALEERIQELTSSGASSLPVIGGGEGGRVADLHQTIQAKDHYIQQLEKQLSSQQTESNKVRARLRKKIKTLTTHLSEAKQESSIAQLELRDQNEQLQEELQHSQATGERASSSSPAAHHHDMDKDKESRMKIILDLSAELSDQADKISQLERQLKAKDEEIKRLKQERVTPSTQVSESSRQGDSSSGAASNESRRNLAQHGSGPQRPGNPKTGSRYGVTPVETAGFGNSRGLGSSPGQHEVSESLVGRLTLHRQSTALSDSDSDWEMETPASKIHSAPPRMRVKSAVSAVDNKNQNNNNNNNADWGQLDTSLTQATDDGDIAMGGKSEREKMMMGGGRHKRRSGLKNKQEQERNMRSQRGLIGPTLAFVQPIKEQLDTSCNNTPADTPRNADSALHLAPRPVVSFAI